jgi:inosine/xanthosine triphosphatase
MKISVGTTSALKIRALEDALKKLGIQAEIVSVKTDSGVSDQPFGYTESKTGAMNRARAAFEQGNFDMALGIESGLIEIEGDYFDIACVYIVTNEDDSSIAYSAGYFTPKWIIDEIKKKNTEYGHITQRLSGDEEKDPLKYFSEGKTKREDVLSQAIEIALVKVFNKSKYTEQASE